MTYMWNLMVITTKIEKLQQRIHLWVKWQHKMCSKYFFSFLNEGILDEVIVLNIRTIYKKMYMVINERNKIRMMLNQP